jgi:hypothetical protein
MNPKYLDRSIQWLRIQYCLCVSENQFHKELSSFGISERPSFTTSSATTHHFISLSGEPISIVCIANFDDKNPILIAALLVHEAVHIWQRNCELIGEDNPGHENEAYSIQWLSQELMYEFVRQTAYQKKV